MPLSATTLSTETPPSPQCHINDDIEGVTIPVDEWIAKELARIKEKQEPRHCHDYEALIEVIEEISRMPPSMMMVTMKQPQQLNFNTDNTTNNISDSYCAENDDDSNGSAVTLPYDNNDLDPPSMLLLLPSPPISPITSSSMMVLLGRAFISLWKYCWDDQYAPHHPYPVGLLLDIEKITLRLHSNRTNTSNNNDNNNSNNKNNEIMNNVDDISLGSNHPTNASRKKIMVPAIMQGMIQAQLSKAFYIQTPTPPDATPSCLPWLSSFQVIQQWIFPLSIPDQRPATLYPSSSRGGDNTATTTTTTTGWHSSFITGMDAYRSAKLSLPFTSHFSHLPATSTVDHLEQLMQKTHL